MENYWRYRIMGKVKRVKLKPGVIPHIFKCQRSVLGSTSVRKGVLKRERIRLMGEVLKTVTTVTPEASTSAGTVQEEFDKHVSFEEYLISEDISHADKSFQVNLKPSFRSKAVNTKPTGIDAALSPILRPSTNAATSPFKIAKIVTIKESQFEDSNSDGKSSILSDSNDSDDYKSEHISSVSDATEDETLNDEFKLVMQRSTVMAIEKNPKLFLGLPKKSYFIIKMLGTKAPARILDILLTLKKIRLNDPFAILGIHFGMSPSNASRIFRKTLILIASLLQELIVWPDNRSVRLRLPIPFRARYGRVVSIIDCLEIEIEKPSNPLHQSLTWSQYKGCNTLKYLISCTPDGLVNFISIGYGGRASDVVIVEDCGYLNKLTPGIAVMADRGFKNLSHLLQQKSCVLIRPPSVSAGVPSTPQEVKESKRIAALRIHVERVIGRLREFNMLLPHACIDNHHVSLLDYVIIVACGIINLQDVLIKSGSQT